MNGGVERVHVKPMDAALAVLKDPRAQAKAVRRGDAPNAVRPRSGIGADFVRGVLHSRGRTMIADRACLLAERHHVKASQNVVGGP
jgi:hypothetical protein